MEEEEEEDKRFPISPHVPPALLVSVYKNCDKDEDKPRGLVSGFPLLITFETRQVDVEQPWFHTGLNREGALTLLRDRDPGTFLLRCEAVQPFKRF